MTSYWKIYTASKLFDFNSFLTFLVFIVSPEQLSHLFILKILEGKKVIPCWLVSFSRSNAHWNQYKYIMDLMKALNSQEPWMLMCLRSQISCALSMLLWIVCHIPFCAVESYAKLQRQKSFSPTENTAPQVPVTRHSCFCIMELFKRINYIIIMIIIGLSILFNVHLILWYDKLPQISVQQQ